MNEKKILQVTCCIMLSGWFQTFGLYAHLSDQGTYEGGGGLNPDYTASVLGETKQINFKVCIVSTICRGVFNLF